MNKLSSEIEQLQAQVKQVENNSSELRKAYEEADEMRVNSDREVREQSEANERFKQEYNQAEVERVSSRDAIEHYKWMPKRKFSKN